ncbi:MAG: glycoside hydrolase family 3 C-terminal domain-containing protein [Firmicutes bacterium]|nr:glycoside hydrolase family 3 C-terminal domain-containing protein [Bacillota bacterium]
MNLRLWTNEALSPEERAEALLRDLSLDEKMAQVGCVFPFGKLAQDMDWISSQALYGIGQVSTLELRRIETLEECAAWQRRVQEIVIAKSPHRIPAIFHMEGLCGAFIQDSTSFPAGIARGAGWDPDLEEEIAKAVSRQEAACGITQIFAPVLDISRDSRMGRQGESYGEDPTLAAALGSAYTRGIRSTETAGRRPESVAKHFLAFHNSQGGIHGTHSDTPPRLLREIYGKPFQAAIQDGLRGVMPCYCSLNGEPVSASKEILTDLLREEMGFDGLAVSDYGAVGNAHSVQHIGESFAEAGLRCMEAGMDMELPSPSGWNGELKAMFQSGEADIAILDRAVLRVLTAKFCMGLFEHPFALQGKALQKAFSEPKDRELSLRSARESLVLLKNDGALPLSKNIKKLAVIGPHADSARKFFGGYTHLCMMESTYAIANSIAGVSGVMQTTEEIKTVPDTNIQSDEGEEFDAILHRQKPGCKSLLEELRARLPETEIVYARGYHIAGSDESGFSEALALIQDADAVLLTLGGKYGTCSMASMGEGVDAANINLPACQDAFIRAAAQYGKPLIGVHFDGRPISSDAADECLSAILEAWSPAECGAEAVTDALLGDYNPGGKLPVSVAYHAGQIPIYYNHPYGSAWHQGESIGFVNYVDLPHTPRYFFGYGLSYSSFAYSDLELSSSEISPDEALTVSVRITNTGERAGDEVVQIYISDRFASRTRPVQELAGFCRIHLNAGETKTVRFTLQPSQLAFLDGDMKWKIEKGAFDFRIGASSEDRRLSGSFTVTKDAWIDGKKRAMTAQTEVKP